MTKLLKKLWKAITSFEDVKSISLWFWPGLIGVATGLKAKFDGVPIHWVIFSATGIFAFCMIGYEKFQQNNLRSRLEYKLFPSSVHGIVEGTEDDKNDISLCLELRNTSDFELFLKLDEAHHSIGKSTERPEHEDWDTILPPKSTATLGFPTIRIDRATEEYKGEISLRMKYGKAMQSDTECSHLMKFQCSFNVTILRPIGRQVIQSAFTHTVKKLEYEKI